MYAGIAARDERIAAYLAQQQHAAAPPQPPQAFQNNYEDGEGDGTSSGAIVEVPTNEELEDFKNQVRIWLELDNTLRKLKAAVKERQAAKRELTDRILDFMGRYNIEDLNTRDGKLRYKVVSVKEPLTQNVIKSRIKEKIQSGSVSDTDPDVVVADVFERSGTVKKAVLKRLKRRSARMDVGGN